MAVAIVAIPSPDDIVWRLSSEKVPHLTLLSLGENLNNVSRVTEFLQHVADTSMTQFGMDVDRRGVLGDKDADVLFFGEFSRKRLKDLRAYLLTDPDIFLAYHRSEQFPEWIPHLTMGYPDNPAQKDDRDYPGISWVNFDRLALWTGEFEGVEFTLGSNNSLSMSDADREFLAHYGVKGMKWGVRKEDPAAGTTEHRAVVPGLNVESGVPAATKRAAVEVSGLIKSRYGLEITDIKTIPHDHPERSNGLMGYVEVSPGKQNGVVYVNNQNIGKVLKSAEDIGWFAKDCGNERAFLTHEAAHAIFHSSQIKTAGFLGPKTSGGNIKARNKALQAAVKTARKSGIRAYEFTSKVSGYSQASNQREEVEAELFAQYHWSPNPPPFVKTWGETLHHELGIDGTPFKDRR